MSCGVAGIAAANPTDVVKVRQQGGQQRGGLLEQYAAVVRESGTPLFAGSR
jgi:hypothetical protein